MNKTYEQRRYELAEKMAQHMHSGRTLSRRAWKEVISFYLPLAEISLADSAEISISTIEDRGETDKQTYLQSLGLVPQNNTQ